MTTFGTLIYMVAQGGSTQDVVNRRSMLRRELFHQLRQRVPSSGKSIIVFSDHGEEATLAWAVVGAAARVSAIWAAAIPKRSRCRHAERHGPRYIVAALLDR